ncbi:MAG: GTP-binding protein, partial [Gammaproteobacteria bacterium]|nr:GTP-binding protein [Gammaproteobacteria bacterium]
MIDTNLIIGRLGSGKTCCIMHLLTNKPENENWAVIVNEFGQIGIDAALLEPETTDSLSITEIAGGCICCAAQSQLHVTMTKLIRQYRPDRILIEATGLGHPAGIIDLLRDEYLHKVININSIISVIDLSLFNLPNDIFAERSPINTENFKHQNQLADIVVLNKSDLASESAFENANKYLDTFYPEKIK